MGKVRELAKELGKYPRLGGGFYFTREHSIELDCAEAEDAAAHAAELEAKDALIAELEDGRQAIVPHEFVAGGDTAGIDARGCYQVAGDGQRHDAEPWYVIAIAARRIAELEAELAKRELPPLPESVREEVERWRSIYGHRPLIAFIDKLYPAPVPQWELDAQRLESFHLMTDKERIDIAARIREAHRVSK